MSELAPLPKARGHLSFIWLGVLLVIVGITQVQLDRGASTPSTTVDPLAIQTVGEPAPDFTVRLIGEDTTFTLSESLATDGRPVILNFWASWCFPCRQEMPVLDAAARANPQLTFIGLATDDTEAGSAAFAAEVAVSYPLGWDSTGLIGQKYGALLLPMTIVIDANGTIVARKPGELTVQTLDLLIATLQP